MYQAKFYKNQTRENVIDLIKKEGFNPIIIRNEPGYIYARHEHPETKLLAFLEGSMEIAVGKKTYTCFPGDKILIPGNTPHEAIVGENGCTFLWAEKLEEKI